jgi:hypothetical protein
MGKDDKKNFEPGFPKDRELNLGNLEEKIQALRGAVHAAAEKPDSFWKRQQDAIVSNLTLPAFNEYRRPALLWTPIVVALVTCLFFFVESSKAPTPDLAAGSDQELLVGIERALNRNQPEAFDPIGAIEAESGPTDHSDNSK